MNTPVVIVAPRGRDAAVIAQVLDRVAIESRICEDLERLPSMLDESAAVIITEETLVGDSVHQVLDWVEGQRPWSDLAFIVLAAKQTVHRSDAHRSILEGLGNAVLLERPLNADSLASAARVALRARRRQLALRDLTDTMETRVVERTQALAESEERFRATFEGFPEGLMVLSVAEGGRFSLESLNVSAARCIEVSADEVRGRAVDEVLPEAVRPEMLAQLRSCVGQQRSVTFTQDMACSGGDGTFEITLTPMRSGFGGALRLLVVLRDVTERNRLEERLRTAQKLEAIGQLTGGVAHDFNNLLQIVLSGLTLMDRLEDPARRGKVIDSVRRAAQRGGELTKRLLTIARRQSLHPEPIDLGTWLGDGAADLLARTLRGDIRVDVQVPTGLPPIEVDAAELELAVVNLAVNARDAMQGGGTLTLSADLAEVDEITDPDELSGTFVRLAVTDTGVGMSADVQARAFEPFFTTKEVGKGTGLGLAQVYGFARQSGGGVRLRSAPGQGTTVSLLLPIAQAEPAPRPTEQEGEAPLPAVRGSILVCEDDDDVAALVVDMLGQLGHVPIRVSTAAAALGALADGRGLDLLFTDVLMPGGMDGLALAREATRRRPGLKVLLTTGYTGGGPGAEPIGVPVLRKPYSIDDLGTVLKRVLSPSEPAQPLARLSEGERVSSG